MSADYNPDSIPTLTDAARLLPEVYAAELTRHATSARDQYGLTSGSADSYKKTCLDAARLLRDAGSQLRRNGRWAEPVPEDVGVGVGDAVASFVMGVASAVLILL